VRSRVSGLLISIRIKKAVLKFGWSD
jgi:hypothetical protein